MKFEEEKYFRPYIPLHRRCAPSPSQRILSTKNLLSRTRINDDHSPAITKSSRSPATKQRKNSDKPIWDLLYDQGIEQRKNIEYKHKLKIEKLDEECTFKPLLRGKSERYFQQTQCTFFDRNTIWHENKIKRQVKEREQQTSRNLKQCTFTPIFSTKPRRRPKENLNRTEYVLANNEVSSRFVAPKPKKMRFDDIRGQIRRELLNVKI